MDAFFGQWKMKSMEGEKELQSAVGIPEQLRDKFDENKLKMTTEYAQDGDVFTSKLTPGPGMPAIEEKFKLDEEYDSRDLLGVPTKVTVTFKDGTVTETRKCQNYEAVQYRSLQGELLHTRTEIKGVVMTTIMERA